MRNDSQQVAIDPALSFGLNFDSQDLRANRQGQISARQVGLLRDKRRQKPPISSWVDRITGGVFYVIYGVTPHMHQWNLVGADITATLADSQHGQVTLPKSTTPKDKGLAYGYQIAVNHQRYKVDRRALGSFRQDREYTVYYAPRSRHALSADYD